MDSRWYGFTLPVFGRGSLHLMRRLDAVVARNAGEGEWEDASRTRWYFDRAGREDPHRLRRFVASAEQWQLSPGRLPDWALVSAIKDLIDRGDLVGVYREVPGSRKAKTSDGAAQHRQLVRKIERETRGKLMNSGRAYKLTVGLADVPDRDRYEVVLQHDATRILDDLAGQAGTTSTLGALLAQARDRLTRDWRPPFQPNGLILLRRVIAARMPTVDLGSAMTPSQIRKAKLGWIIVELVDDEDEPWDRDVDLTSTDGSKSSYNFAEAGVLSLDNIEPGTVTVEVKYDFEENGAEEPESADVAPEEPSPAEAAESAEPMEELQDFAEPEEDSEPETPPPEEDLPTDSRRVKLRLHDEDAHPMPQTFFRFRLPDAREWSEPAQADAQGWAEFDTPTGAGAVVVAWDRLTGAEGRDHYRHRRKLYIGWSASEANEAAGDDNADQRTARRQLHNLGYEHAALLDAVSSFQRHYNIQETGFGELTKARLKQIFESNDCDARRST